MRERAVGLVLLAVLTACQSTASELGGLRAAPPLDYAVLVTGGAFLADDPELKNTFQSVLGEPAGPAEREPIRIDEVLTSLEEGRVFRRVALDADPASRQQVQECVVKARREGLVEAEREGLRPVLQRAREEGFDFVLVIEELRDGPIERYGINSRWPVTFATWILLGVGALIPDHTFESRAALRISVRDLQTGQALYETLLTGGPVELALTERSDVLGLLTSVLVPPFWVGSDDGEVQDSVRAVTRRRLLVSLARELKSASVRQRLREESAAAISLDGDELVVESAESLSSVRLRVDPPLPEATGRSFAAELLKTRVAEGNRIRYRWRLPPEVRGRPTQVLVATLRGAVASATLLPGGGQ